MTIHFDLFNPDIRVISVYKCFHYPIYSIYVRPKEVSETEITIEIDGVWKILAKIVDNGNQRQQLTSYGI